jgi:hypothetical protein
VTVQPGFKTPLQRVIKGTVTIEGFVSGKGTLRVASDGSETATYEFDENNKDTGVEVLVGQTMQWHANGDIDLVFYEICEPPYEDGRFENIDN